MQQSSHCPLHLLQAEETASCATVGQRFCGPEQGMLQSNCRSGACTCGEKASQVRSRSALEKVLSSMGHKLCTPPQHFTIFDNLLQR